MSSLRSFILIGLASAVMACGSATAVSPAPSPVSSILVTTPQAAWAAVVVAEPRFGGIAPKDPTLIGQSAWYEVQPASGVGAFVALVTVGWGDCQAGCIDRHLWTVAVLPDGTASLVSQDGPPVPAGELPGLGAFPTGMTVVATAAPVCPVESNPPDPACAARPVAGATIAIKDSSGATAAEGRTGLTGAVDLAVSPGIYTVEARPVEGLMGTPDPVSVTVTDGLRAIVELGYDTGIR